MKMVTKGAAALLLASNMAFAAVLATVNGEDITTEEVNIILNQNQLPAFESIDEENQKKLINSMIERKLIYQHAKSQGVEKNKKYQAAQKALSENVAIDVWMEDYIKSLPVTDNEAKKLYDENIDRFKQPEQVRARHILVGSEAEAKDLIKTLNSKKASELESAFSDLARTKSTDKGSGANGGDLGFFPREQMVKEFSDAAFKLKKGEITKAPVKSAFGYHIIYLVDKKAAKTVSFNEAKEQLQEAVRMQKIEGSLEKLTGELKQKAKISYPNK